MAYGNRAEAVTIAQAIRYKASVYRVRIEQDSDTTQ